MFSGARHYCKHTADAAAAMAPIREASDVDALVKANKVLVFSKTTCPWCDKIKRLFREQGVEAKYVEIDELPDAERDAVREILEDRTKQTSVPNVFVSGRHVGESPLFIRHSLLAWPPLATHDFHMDLLDNRPG